MNNVIAQLVGGAKDGDIIMLQIDSSPMLLKIKTSLKREALYKKVKRLGIIDWRYEFFGYWDGKVEFVEESP